MCSGALRQAQLQVSCGNHWCDESCSKHPCQTHPPATIKHEACMVSNHVYHSGESALFQISSNHRCHESCSKPPFSDLFTSGQST